MISGPILLRGRPLLPGSGPFLFGILNCTPDSFSDGGQYPDAAAAIAAGLRLACEARMPSTWAANPLVPGASQYRMTSKSDAHARWSSALAKAFGADGPAISIDTRSATVAEAALKAGASIVNDVSGAA